MISLLAASRDRPSNMSSTSDSDKEMNLQQCDIKEDTKV